MSNEIMTAENAAQIVSAPQPNLSPINVWTDKAAFDQLARAAGALSKTSIIPQTYQGKPEDCFVALEMATRMNVPPMMVMQNLNVIKGKPSWTGQACKTIIELCGKFRDVELVYTGEKGTDNRGCYVSAIRVSDGKLIEGTEVTIQMAKAEGWTSNSKWRNMPEQMLGYRASSFFARMHCPEALMGVQTAEEIYDAEYSTRKEKKAVDLTNALKGEDVNA